MKVLTLLLASLLPALAWGLDVKNLRTEDYRNPIGIDVACPRLSWELSSERRNTTQVSYNIRIATDAQMGSVVWESGDIASERNVDVLAEGFTAQARTRYYWQVAVTDNHGETAVSQEKAYFETGLMDDQQWNGATWIKATNTPVGYVPDGETITDYEITLSFEVQNGNHCQKT